MTPPQADGVFKNHNKPGMKLIYYLFTGRNFNPIFCLASSSFANDDKLNRLFFAAKP